MSLKKTFVSTGAAIATLATTSLAFAQETAATHAGSNASDVKMWSALAAGIAIGAAVLGGTTAQGRATATALDGIARNPGAADKIFTPMIIGLALIESLVIYALIISFLLLGKVH